MASSKTVVDWGSEELKAALTEYCKSRMIPSLPALVRMSVCAYVRQRKPKAGTELYEKLKAILE